MATFSKRCETPFRTRCVASEAQFGIWKSAGQEGQENAWEERGCAAGLLVSVVVMAGGGERTNGDMAICLSREGGYLEAPASWLARVCGIHGACSPGYLWVGKNGCIAAPLTLAWAGAAAGRGFPGSPPEAGRQAGEGAAGCGRVPAAVQPRGRGERGAVNSLRRSASFIDEI